MQRFYCREKMDLPGLDPDLLADDLRNLETLNRFFGGVDVVRRRAGTLFREVPRGAPLEVLDVGSGAGDLCRALLDESRRCGLRTRLLSLDFHPQIQAYARARLGADGGEVRFIRGDARRLPLRDRSVDLVLCTLALHHFTEEDASSVLAEMRRVSRRWALASDLLRTPQALAGVWLATRFMTNPMTRHDGPASVRRAFSEAEFRALAASAGWDGAEFYREPWFRMSLLYRRKT